MSFKAKNLRPLGDNATRGVVPSLWTYYNEDSDTVTTGGYISLDYGIKAKDQVAVIPAAGSGITWHYVTVSGTTATLNAVS